MSDAAPLLSRRPACRRPAGLSALYWAVSLRVGRAVGRISRLTPPGILFFFPCYHMGGAARVHADIMAAVADRKPWVVLTTFLSQDERFLREFEKSARVFDLTRTPFRRLIIGFAMGFFAGVAANRRGTIVFGCNAVPYYRALPYFSGSTRRLDLLHYVVPDDPHVSLPYVAYLDQRIIITPQTREHLMKQYGEHGVPLFLMARVELIENGVLMPAPRLRQGELKVLKVVYVGRGSPEKRIHIVGRIARECSRQKLPVVVTLAGNDVESFVKAEDRPYCRWAGCMTNDVSLSQLYRDSDVLILTSRAEGFPMVIMEAMAEGVVPLVTEALGGIGHHIHDHQNGFLVIAGEESEIVETMVARLALLSSSPAELDRLSAAARSYAVEHFDIAGFQARYRRLLADVAPG
jgi:glycosyltransferase involved in cell wall biosynthesis